ncbi:MAG: hypothetical protein LBR74_07650 [Eubacterium sp.]|nr:hypothetical protein [Eubacterium sp.]
MKSNKKIKKYLLFLPFAMLFILTIGIFFAVSLGIILLTALSLLAIPTGLGMMVGMFGSVASDLSPVSLFFAGMFCGSFVIFLSFAIKLIFPKAVKLFAKIFDWYRIYER